MKPIWGIFRELIGDLALTVAIKVAGDHWTGEELLAFYRFVSLRKVRAKREIDENDRLRMAYLAERNRLRAARHGGE